MKKIGIYVHIPFCKSKCPYCDFYSLKNDCLLQKEYAQKVKKEIISYENISADTIYIGGGTPSTIDGKDIAEIVDTAKKQFSFTDGEITVEVNPSSCSKDFIEQIACSGVNRISLGVQSINDGERKILGRKSDSDEILSAINLIKSFSIDNISLDVMLGIPNQTKDSLKKTLDFCIDSGVKHISAYILKIEENTFFYKNKQRYIFPDDETTAQLYEFCCRYLEKNGFFQYEISNFSLPGFESKHNLKYWNCEEYLGFGPSAHSFFNCKRFFHTSDMDNYIENPIVTVDDGDGGSFEEYTMLKLRLAKGLLEKEVMNDFNFKIPEEIRKRAEKFVENNYVVSDEKGIRLTPKGFLVSNYIISEII